MQGLRLYPDWKMVMVKGDENWVKKLAARGDPDYSTYWDRKQVDEGRLILRPMAIQPSLFLIFHRADSGNSRRRLGKNHNRARLVCLCRGICNAGKGLTYLCQIMW